MKITATNEKTREIYEKIVLFLLTIMSLSTLLDASNGENIREEENQGSEEELPGAIRLRPGTLSLFAGRAVLAIRGYQELFKKNENAEEEPGNCLLKASQITLLGILIGDKIWQIKSLFRKPKDSDEEQCSWLTSFPIVWSLIQYSHKAFSSQPEKFFDGAAISF